MDFFSEIAYGRRIKMYHNQQIYVVAEIGGNFTNYEQAVRLIDEAFNCGVNAVKLQTYRAETISSKTAVFDMENTGVTSQFELFKKYELSRELHERVFSYAREKGLEVFSTPSHMTDVEMLEKLGCCAYKIGSDDAVNLPFLREVARIGKPVILATGMCTMREVQESVDTILSEGCTELVLLHAVTAYPTHPEDVNLSAMQSMMKVFPQLPIGYSDHTIGITAALCAAAMGARVIEKHFTYDKNADGPDHMLSASPQEMKELVRQIRLFEKMHGNGVKMPANSERITRRNNRKSIVVTTDLTENEVLTQENLAIKRPGMGIQPKYLEQIFGRRVNKKKNKDDVLYWNDLI